MKERLERLRQASVLVVGDLMLDTYQWGDVERISPEAPVPVVRVQREEFRLGGAANVVSNLAALGCRVGVCGVVGEDGAGERALAMLEALGAGREGIVRDAARPTIEKTRVMARSQQMLRYDREDTAPLAPQVAGAVAAYLAEAIGSFDGVIVSDYGKGLVTAELMEGLARAAAGAGKHVLVDPKGMTYDKYRGASCLTPNEQEAALAARTPASGEEAVLAAGRALMAELGLGHLCITRGAQGVLAMEGATHRQLPARAREVFDVTGAGDTVIAAIGCAWAVGAGLEDALHLANVAAGIVVGKLGAATASPAEILHELAGEGA